MQGALAESRALVLDSSAIISLFFREKLEDEINRIIEGRSNFATVDIAYAEVGSAAWKSIVILKQEIEPVNEALRQATNFISDICNVVPSRELVNEALELGTKNKIQVYDCLFLCLAKKLGTQPLTTDQRLHNRVSEIKELRGFLFPMDFPH